MLLEKTYDKGPDNDVFTESVELRVKKLIRKFWSG